MTRLIIAFLLVSILIGPTATPARADLEIALSNVTVAAGSVGTMDIAITSTDGTDTLSDFSLGLQIAPTSGTASLAMFTATQPVPFGNPDYVFAGSSFAQDNGLPLWYGPTTTNYPSDTINGGDSDDSSQGYVQVATAANQPYSFLASVQFEVPAGAPSTDQFQVSLVNSLTEFDDANGDPIPDYTVTGGLITVSSAAVPVPPSLALFASGSFALLLGRFGRSRRRARGSARRGGIVTR